MGLKEVLMRLRTLRLFGLGAALALWALATGAVGIAQRVLTVCPSGCDFTSIQAAISAAPEGSTIQVKAGTYKENLIITKPLSLVGEGPGKTIIQGGIAILATKIINVMGFTVQGQGIQVQDSQTVSLLNNVIEKSASDGLSIANSATVTVRGSTIQNSKGSGIVIGLGSKAAISANTIHGNGGDGISIGASQADLRDNLITNNAGCGIRADSASQLSGSGNTSQANGGGNTCGNVPSELIVPTPPQPPLGMVLIPAGEFQMGDSFKEGDSDERPVHTVFVSAFYMDKYEVTKGFWDEVANWAAANGYDIEAADGAGKAGNHPVQDVTWYEAVKWANARSEREGLTPCYYTDRTQATVYRKGNVDVPIEGVKWSGCGYRLPTEAEWEKAARGGCEGHRFPWCDSDEIQHARANYDSSGGYSYDTSPTQGYNPACKTGDAPYTCPVGSFAPNGYGLYDMAGNVWEWVWDWYNGGYYTFSPGSDPRGPASGSTRVVRGGSWFNRASDCRVANRRDFSPNVKIYYSALGFRLVRTAP
jgi:sulfatase modifying factor 1